MIKQEKSGATNDGSSYRPSGGVKRPLPSLDTEEASEHKKLRQIFERYRHYAKGSDGSPASELAVNMLQHGIMDDSSKSTSCRLCLESVAVGEGYTIMPCGHIFHQGSGSGNCSSTACKGILYWLSESCACPVCRHEVDRKYKRPSEEERLLIPILKRQISALKAREEAVKKKDIEIAELKKQLDMYSQSTTPAMLQGTVSRQDSHTFQPIMSKQMRREILVRVVNTLGRRVSLSVKNLETLSLVMAKIEKEVLQRSGVKAITVDSERFQKLITKSIETIHVDRNSNSSKQ